MNQLNIKEKYREAAEKIKKFAQTRKGKIVLSTSACALVALIITGVVASGIPQSSDKVAGSQKEAAVSDSSSVSSGSKASSAASGTGYLQYDRRKWISFKGGRGHGKNV